MKKIFAISLCICLMLSVAVVSAEEAVTDEIPQFDRGEMPQGERPQFNPENMPQRGRFNPDNMPEFNPEDMPQREMPQFNPHNMPQWESRQQGTQTQTPAEESTPVQTQSPDPDNTEPAENRQSVRQFPNGMNNRSDMTWGQQEQPEEVQQPMTFYGFITTYATPIASVVLLGLAFVFVIFYKRKNY